DIQKASDDIVPVLEKESDLEQVESSMTEAYDQYTLVANQEKLSEHGLTVAQIGMALSTAGEPDVLTTVNHDGKDTDVIIEVEEKEFDTIDELTAVELETPLGTTVEIADVVDVKEGKSPE